MERVQNPHFKGQKRAFDEKTDIKVTKNLHFRTPCNYRVFVFSENFVQLSQLTWKNIKTGMKKSLN